MKFLVCSVELGPQSPGIQEKSFKTNSWAEPWVDPTAVLEVLAWRRSPGVQEKSWRAVEVLACRRNPGVQEKSGVQESSWHAGEVLACRQSPGWSWTPGQHLGKIRRQTSKCWRLGKFWAEIQVDPWANLKFLAFRRSTVWSQTPERSLGQTCGQTLRSRILDEVLGIVTLEGQPQSKVFTRQDLMTTPRTEGLRVITLAGCLTCCTHLNMNLFDCYWY